MTLSHSIVIPVHGHVALTLRCLEVLLDQAECSEAEIAVVDDGSGDETAEAVQAFGDRVRLIARPASGGFAAACNEGSRATVGEAIVFLNNDTAPQEGWLAALLDHAAANPEAAVIGSKLLYPDGTVQHAGVTFCQDRFPRHLYAGFPGNHPAVSKSRRMGAVSAACALVRRGPFEQMGGFDEKFRNGLEDVDLCLRLGEGGHEVHYCPESVVRHLEYASRDARPADRSAGERRYLSRWGDRVEPDDISYYLEDGLLRIRYEETYPGRLRVSPHLASIEDDGRELEANRLLNARSRQAFELLREAVRLTVLRSDQDPPVRARRGANRSATGEPPWPARPGSLPRPRSPLPDSVGELRALLAEAHDQLHRRDEELALQLHEVQVAVFGRPEERREGEPASNGSASERTLLTPSERLGYRRLARDLRDLVRSCVPTDAAVAVVSKGDEELLRLDGRRARHFPCTPSGEFPGHYPSDSGAAIDNLEALREAGFTYIVFPGTALWWLDHYAGFREHLARHYEEAGREEGAGLVYHLRTGGEHGGGTG